MPSRLLTLRAIGREVGLLQRALTDFSLLFEDSVACAQPLPQPPAVGLGATASQCVRLASGVEEAMLAVMSSRDACFELSELGRSHQDSAAR